jgi:hypothetical protein
MGESLLHVSRLGAGDPAGSGTAAANDAHDRRPRWLCAEQTYNFTRVACRRKWPRVLLVVWRPDALTCRGPLCPIPRFRARSYSCVVLWINCKCYVQLRQSYFLCLDVIPPEPVLAAGKVRQKAKATEN